VGAGTCHAICHLHRNPRTCIGLYALYVHDYLALINRPMRLVLSGGASFFEWGGQRGWRHF